jgi:hypothetical protein
MDSTEATIHTNLKKENGRVDLSPWPGRGVEQLGMVGRRVFLIR